MTRQLLHQTMCVWAMYVCMCVYVIINSIDSSSVPLLLLLLLLSIGKVLCYIMVVEGIILMPWIQMICVSLSHLLPCVVLRVFILCYSERVCVCCTFALNWYWNRWQFEMTTSALFNQIDLLSVHSSVIKLLRFWRNSFFLLFFIAESGLVE